MSFRTRLYARLMLAAKRGAAPTFMGAPPSRRVQETIPTASSTELWGCDDVGLSFAAALPASERLPLGEEVGVRVVELLQRTLPNTERSTRWGSRAGADAHLAEVLGSVERFGPWADYPSDAAWARQLVQGPMAPLLERRGEDYVVDASILAGLPRHPGLCALGCVAAIRFEADGTPYPTWIELEEGGRVTPGDGERWEIARLVAGAGLQTWLVVGPHLLYTHFLTAGPLATLVHAELPPEHSIRRMLTPHTLGSLRVNHRANRTLLGPNGNVQSTYSFPWSSVQRLLPRAAAAFDRSRLKPEEDHRRHGLADISASGAYPYGQDALLIWDALHGFVRGWVGARYPDAAALRADADLGPFLARAPKLLPGGLMGTLTGTGEGGAVDALVDSLTRLVFGVTAYHKMVGGISLEFLTHPYFLPHRAWEGAAVDDVVPYREESEANLAAKYGTTYRTWGLVGDWSALAVTGDEGARFRALQEDLAGVGRTIDERNAARRHPFPHLHPDTLESSVAV